MATDSLPNDATLGVAEETKKSVSDAKSILISPDNAWDRVQPKVFEDVKKYLSSAEQYADNAVRMAQKGDNTKARMDMNSAAGYLRDIVKLLRSLPSDAMPNNQVRGLAFNTDVIATEISNELDGLKSNKHWYFR